MKSKDNLFVGMISFLYTLYIGLVTNLIILPKFLPQFHAGNGLFKGFDSVIFHQKALSIISKESPIQWLIQNFQFGDSSIYVGFQALVYKLLIPEPSILIPISSLFISLSAIALSNILFKVTRNRIASIIGVIPFVAFPSSLQWYAQWNKDPFFNFGILIVMYSLIAAINEKEFKFWDAFMLIMGCLICFFLRPYSIYFFSCSLGITCIIFLSGLFSHCQPFKLAAIRLFTMIVIFIVLAGSLMNWPFYKNRSSYIKESVKIENFYEVKDQSNTVKLIKGGGYPGIYFEHNHRFFLLRIFEQYVYKMSYIRGRFLWSHNGAKTNIDTEYEISSTSKFIQYMPKAMIVGLFYPTPDMLLSSNGNFMEKVILLESCIIYLGILFFFYGSFIAREKKSYLFISPMVSFYLCLLAFSTPNYGTLYRYRYAFLMIVVGIGYCELVKLYIKWKSSLSL